MSELLTRERVAAYNRSDLLRRDQMDASQTVAPERSLAQRFEALQRANDVRSYRAELKRDVRHGLRTTAEVVAAPEAELATMKVRDLLLASPKVGRVKAGKYLSVCGISPSKTLVGLTMRQRQALAALLRGGPSVRR